MNEPSVNGPTVTPVADPGFGGGQVLQLQPRVSPTGAPFLPPAVVPWLVAAVSVAIAGQQTLPPHTIAQHICAWVVAVGAILGLASPGLRRAAPVAALLLVVFTLGCAGVQQRTSPMPPAHAALPSDAPVRAMAAPAAAVDAPPVPTVPGPVKDCPALLGWNMGFNLGTAAGGFLISPAGLPSLARADAPAPSWLPVVEVAIGAATAVATTGSVYTGARLMAQCQTSPGP